ncbi:hypothetical protein [Piscibacillus salipiscarius]|uniref:Uncharacterized protein n=1 Tax=Piscibacillus salipiscarius TaxID=299480 RepID=A0ABW5QC90_9BACI|nr:hypothetical protein [Piscibacillus salipiscarius]
MNTYSKDHIYNLCKSHLKQYVLIETNQGEQIQGVIVDMDDDNVYLITPVMHEPQRNPYGYSSYGYPFYGPGYGYYPYPQNFGLRRLILPLTAVAALSLLPWY